MVNNTAIDSSSTPQTPNTKTPQQEHTTLVMNAYNIIKELEEKKRDFESFSASQKENFKKIESQLTSIDEAKTKAMSVIEKETKTYNILLSLWWCFFVGGILSFFVFPIIGFIILYLLSPDMALDKFSIFFTSLFTYLGAGIGMILFGGFQNLYRRVNLLQKEIDRIKNIDGGQN